MRRSMAMLLQQEGHEVLEAATLADALRLIASDQPDVVVTDVHIEGGHRRRRAAARGRGRDRDIEVVLITAFGTIDDAVEAIKAGAYDYLTKPADPERLLITIRRAAERAALAREVRQLGRR